MVSKELSEAAVEFNCILNNSSQEIVNRIPRKFLEFIKSIESKTYIFSYDNKKSLNEQNLKPETRGLISLVYQDYICDEEEKNKYINKCNNYYVKKEKELREQYNPDNLFKNRTSDTIQEIETINENVAMVEYKESIFKKFISKIRSIFNKSK